MADVTGDDNTEPAVGQEVPDRRQTIDLVRVERGEPERRKLRRPTDPRRRRDDPGVRPQ